MFAGSNNDESSTLSRPRHVHRKNNYDVTRNNRRRCLPFSNTKVHPSPTMRITDAANVKCLHNDDNRCNRHRAGGRQLSCLDGAPLTDPDWRRIAALVVANDEISVTSPLLRDRKLVLNDNQQCPLLYYDCVSWFRPRNVLWFC